jgi:hypothetical protein
MQKIFTGCVDRKNSAILTGSADKKLIGFTRSWLGGVDKRFFRIFRKVKKSDVYCKASLIAAGLLKRLSGSLKTYSR